MSEESEQIEDTLLEREDSGYGGTITIGGADYPCSLGTLRSEAQIMAGGFGLQKQRIVVVRKTVLPDATTLHAGIFVVVTDNLDQSYNLKIAPEGINDGIYFWEITLNDRAQAGAK